MTSPAEAQSRLRRIQQFIEFECGGPPCNLNSILGQVYWLAVDGTRSPPSGQRRVVGSRGVSKVASASFHGDGSTG